MFRKTYCSRVTAQLKRAVIFATGLLEVACGVPDTTMPTVTPQSRIPTYAHHIELDRTPSEFEQEFDPNVKIGLPSEQNEKPPKGKPFANGAKEFTDKDIEEIARIWKEEKILTELPEVVAKLVNVAFRNAYGIELPLDLNIKFMTDEEYQKYFGDTAAYFLLETMTIYMRQQPLNSALLGNIYHELGHVLDVLIFRFPLDEARGREHTAWFAHKDLLWESEILLPQMGDNAITLYPEGYPTPTGVAYLGFTTFSDSFLPYFSLYNEGLVRNLWEMRRKVLAEEATDNEIASLSTWLLLGMAQDFATARLAIGKYSKEKFGQIVTSIISDDTFEIIIMEALSKIYSRLMKGKYGNETQLVFIGDQEFCISTTTLILTFWFTQNRTEAGKTDPSACAGFDATAVENHCYSCSQ